MEKPHLPSGKYSNPGAQPGHKPRVRYTPQGPTEIKHAQF